MEDGDDRDSEIRLCVPRAVELRWPAFEALPPHLKQTAGFLAEGLSDEVIALRQQQPLARAKAEVAEVFRRLSVGGRWEIVRLRTAQLGRAG